MTDGLIEFRHSKQKSIVEFAKILGMGYDNYYKIESGDRKPNYNLMLKLKKAYPDADIDNIFFTNSLYKMDNC